MVNIKQKKEFDIRRKGTNFVSDDEFVCATRYCGERRDSDTDVTILTGEFWDDPGYNVLLLMRFHNVDPSSEMPNAQVIKLYNVLKKMMGKGGYEHRRIGGSSGKVEYSSDFFNFVQVSKNNTNYPRFHKSMKFLNLPGNLKIDTYYIGTKEHEVKKTFSCNIKKGGQFMMPPSVMEDFPFLQDFLATKAKSALILYQINGASKTSKIQPSAVKQELSNLKRANSFDWEFLKRNWWQIYGGKRIGSKKEFVMKYFSTMNKHTVVQHCVGYHLDQIKNQPVLENKMCFKMPVKNGDYGRCGAGPNHFVFALLDWPKKNFVRKAVYRALGGDRFVGQRATEANWQAFRALFRIPEIPDNVRGDDDAVQQRINEARVIMRREQEEHPHLMFE